MMTRGTLVYIAGRGFSGSTLLDLLIGSHSEAISTGELRALSDRTRAKGKNFAEDVCTCGAPRMYDCPFWSMIDRRIVERTRHNLGTIDVYDRDSNRAILDAIHDISGRRFVVDSSKQPERLRQLLADDTLDVRPIHLIREPLGEVYSHVKRGNDLHDKAMMYNRDTIELHRTLQGRDHLTVRYEALVRSPRKHLGRIMKWLGLELEDGQFEWTNHEHHNISGNPMRFSDSHEIRLDRTWRRALTFRQKWAIRWLTLPGRFPGSALWWPRY